MLLKILFLIDIVFFRNFVLEVYKKESIEDITLKDGLPQVSFNKSVISLVLFFSFLP